MDREGGNKEKIRKCRERISLDFLILSPFPLHFLIISPFSHSPLPGWHNLCSPVTRYHPKYTPPIKKFGNF